MQKLVVRDAAPHKKNDRREASSRSVTGCGVLGASETGSDSERNRNAGLARIRGSAARMPPSKSPVLRPSWKNLECGLDVGSRDGPGA